MADNSVLANPPNSTPGDTIRDIDRGGLGVKTPVVQLDIGGAAGEQLVTGAMPVTVAALPLPAGAATAAKQDTINTTLGTPMQQTGGTVTTVPPADASTNVTKVGGAAVTLGAKASAASIPVVLATDEAALPVTAASLPLPAGAATAAKQDTINTTLGSPMQQTGGTVTTTPPADATTNITKVGGTAVTLGAKASAASIPVVLATDEAALPVTAASLPLPAGAATAAKQDTLLAAVGSPLQAGGAVSVSNFPATQAVSAVALPLPAGAAIETGGNLAAIAASTAAAATSGAAQATSDAAQVTQLTALLQLVELNKQILATLQALRLTNATAFGVDVQPSALLDDPTFN